MICTRLHLLAILVLTFASSAVAQLRIVGAISGTVEDPSGAAVPKATVVLKDEATGITRGTTTSEGGSFLFPDLAVGSYEVTVTMAGFRSEIVNHIAVSTSQTTDLKISLRVGQQTETVTVEGAAPVLETTSQLIATTQTSKTINELPLGGRNTLALTRLMPGASPPTGGSTRYNNLPGGAVNVTLDGINDASNGYKSGGTVFYMTVPMRVGAVEEVSVETGGLGADSGAQSGANIKFVTRRGGRQYHGSAFYQPSSEQFNANTWARNAQGLRRVFNRMHEFGGNFSGPLVPFGPLKEKLFFFANFERNYQPLFVARRFNLMTSAAQRGDYTYLVSGTTNQLRTVSVTQAANDWDQLLPALEQIDRRLQQQPRQTVADAGYTTRAVIEEMAERKMDFLGSMPREDASSGRTAPNRLPPSAFVYQPETDRYLCPGGKYLGYEGRIKNERGLISYRYQARREDCEPCVWRPECCPANQKRGRGLLRIEESAVVQAFRQKMATAQAQKNYRRRGRVAKFCNAWIKSKLGLRQFHVRGLAKVRTETLWACLTYNLQQWILIRKSSPAAATGC
jgi:hypothetical protein